MLVSEEGAKKLWCPKVQFVSVHRMLYSSRDGLSVVDAKDVNCCLASGCAMWRWASHVKGYCGFAGYPPEMRKESVVDRMVKPDYQTGGVYTVGDPGKIIETSNKEPDGQEIETKED